MLVNTVEYKLYCRKYYDKIHVTPYVITVDPA